MKCFWFAELVNCRLKPSYFLCLDTLWSGSHIFHFIADEITSSVSSLIGLFYLIFFPYLSFIFLGFSLSCSWTFCYPFSGEEKKKYRALVVWTERRSHSFSGLLGISKLVLSIHSFLLSCPLPHLVVESGRPACRQILFLPFWRA